MCLLFSIMMYDNVFVYLCIYYTHTCKLLCELYKLLIELIWTIFTCVLTGQMWMTQLLLSINFVRLPDDAYCTQNHGLDYLWKVCKMSCGCLQWSDYLQLSVSVHARFCIMWEMSWYLLLLLDLKATVFDCPATLPFH